MFNLMQKTNQTPFKGVNHNYHVHLLKTDESLFFIGIFGLIFAMSVFYLVEINKITSISYKINDYEKKLSMVKKENHALKIETASLSSIYRIENEAASLGMVAIKGAQYMKTGQAETARR